MSLFHKFMVALNPTFRFVVVQYDKIKMNTFIMSGLILLVSKSRKWCDHVCGSHFQRYYLSNLYILFHAFQFASDFNLEIAANEKNAIQQ